VRVLVAEDDDAMRQMLVETLREVGYVVIEVRNGKQLADCVLHPESICPRPDLVISDVRMPGRTGLDVLASLRASDWTMPVIMITAFGDAVTHAEAMRLGAIMVMDKPFDMDTLVDAVQSIAPPDITLERRPVSGLDDAS
jgi:DNA-binding NtrC family response regulator